MTRSHPGRIKRRVSLSVAYAVAIAAPLVALAIRMQLSVFFVQRPLLIFFVLPILLAAYLGGLWPGLLATLVTALVTLVFLVPPTPSFAIGSVHDAVQWLMLVVTGIVISALSESLHRARQRAEAYPELQQQLGDIAATVPGVIYSFRMDLQGHFSFPYASPAFEELMGLDSDRARRDAAFTFERMHPDDAARLTDSIAESARNLTAWHDEFRLRHALRGEIWIEGRSMPKRLPDGSTIWHGFATDITERKRMEASVKESRAFMQATMDSLSAHICVLDADGTIIAVNKAWREFAIAALAPGATAAEGANYLRVCDHARGEDEALARAFAQGIREVLDGRRDFFEAEYPCHAPSEQRWFVGRVTRFSGEAAGRAVVAHQNITRQKIAEEAVSQAEILHRKLISTVPDLIWLKSPEGVYLHCNPAFERLYGAKEADIIGKTDVDFVDKELAAFFRRHDLAAIAAGKPTINEEWLTFAADGYRGYFETIKAPLHDAEGNVFGVLGIARDITSRHKAEMELSAQIDELRRWQAVTMGREERIAELKREVNGLAVRLGLARPYNDPPPAPETPET